MTPPPVKSLKDTGLNTLVCRVNELLIQSGFSHVFAVYSEPIEIVWR